MKIMLPSSRALLLACYYCCCCLLLVVPSTAWNSNNNNNNNNNNIFAASPLQKIQKDYQALTRRVTARHILLPNDKDVCLTLKQKIRNSDRYVVDAFEQAAIKYSRDEDTRARGGLLGELVPQGYCRRSPELDEACFRVRLGVVEGPIETEYGMHLLLVSERTNCPRLDGPNTKLEKATGSENNESVLVPSPQVGQVDVPFALGQATFWVVVFFAGGILAEVVSRLV